MYMTTRKKNIALTIWIFVSKVMSLLFNIWAFQVVLVVRNPFANAGDPSSISGSGRSAGEGIGYLLQYSWAYLVAQLVKNLPAMWETWV